uniref:Uncharacterized protein n=1 Tax=Caenorhabditis japonica TaxID=281687 RepID=A0A8R1ISZ4_CAEJA
MIDTLALAHMNEADFEWNEEQLRRLAAILPRWTAGEEGHLRLGHIELEAAKCELTSESDIGGVENEFERLHNTSFDLLIDYEEHQKVKESLKNKGETPPVSSWIQRWKRIAEKLGISHVDLTTNIIEFKQIHILPNVVPLLLIGHTTPQNVIIVYGKRRNLKEKIDLQTVLRHSYSNIPHGSLQTIYLLTKNLLDLYSQLFSRQVTPEFRTKHFRCLPSLWLQYDIVGPMLDAIRGKSSPKL